MKFTKSQAVDADEMLIGALLRVPAHAIHRRLIQRLNASGFEDLRLPHIVVFQFPGADGVRPHALAERAGVSKQALNQLLRSLESCGYVVRSSGAEGGNSRVIRYTERGHAAYTRIVELLQEIEGEWIAELGEQRFSELKTLLLRVWDSPLAR
jgi:DNA-binding MarR family transcriptional regulator